MMTILFVIILVIFYADKVNMQNEDPIISAIRDLIGDERILQVAIEKHTNTGRSLMSILKEEKLLDEEQFAKIVAVSNKIEFINLSPEMVDPIAAHMVTSKFANQYNVIPVRAALIAISAVS